MISEGLVLTADLPAGPGSARAARRAVSDQSADLRVLDRVDLLVLASELASALDHGVPGTLDLIRTIDGFRIEVARPGAADSLEPVPAEILDEIASEWSVETGLAWAEITTREPLTGEEPDEILLARAAGNGDPEATATLAERHARLASGIARRFTAGSVEPADLEQVAAVGLLGAIERFDPEHGVRFTTFAARTIEGELKRHLRDSGWALHVPRGLQELGLEARRAGERFSQEHGREATIDEIAEIVDADPTEVGRALDARRSFTAASLDAPAGSPENPRRIDRIPAHDARLPVAPEWADVSEALDHLDERDRLIVYLRFFEDLSQSEIADRVGISQMHVSRLLSRSLPRLRRLIEGAAGS